MRTSVKGKAILDAMMNGKFVEVAYGHYDTIRHSGAWSRAQN